MAVDLPPIIVRDNIHQFSGRTVECFGLAIPCRAYNLRTECVGDRDFNLLTETSDVTIAETVCCLTHGA